MDLSRALDVRTTSGRSFAQRAELRMSHLEFSEQFEAEKPSNSSSARSISSIRDAAGRGRAGSIAWSGGRLIETLRCAARDGHWRG